MGSTKNFDERAVSVDPSLEGRIFAEVDAVSDEMIEAIRRIVRQKSVRGEPEEGAPFGADVRAALDQTLEVCRGLGFETTNVDGYMGYASWSSEGGNGGGLPLPGYVCAIGHLDVVPEGSAGWKVEPYSAHLENGRITGRGVLDNKGPIYACLYGLWALKRLGLAPNRDVRIIFGCNEESGFNDLRHYLEHEDAPVMGFTPDCKYPVVYAERGRMGVRLAAVPGEGEGREALLARFFSFVNEYVLSAKPNGERFGIDCNDEEFGVTEVRNYKLAFDEGAPAVEFAISYPAGITADELCGRLEALAAALGLRLTVTGNLNPVRFEKDCRLVRTLEYAYEHTTGNDGSPVTTTGGTYAKLMPNIVPFGPSFPGQRGIGHQPNEWMDVKDLIVNAKVYALSLYLLSR
ncbi:MAG: Sapep family Mn(2+)-dependent dipeptidase [Coriobacteriaceae bacterium]|nr:Sapep family Mn(2+)-dependent dipeptidase [Coriobacteriaceae bacterium]